MGAKSLRTSDWAWPKNSGMGPGMRQKRAAAFYNLCSCLDHVTTALDSTWEWVWWDRRGKHFINAPNGNGLILRTVRLSTPLTRFARQSSLHRGSGDIIVSRMQLLRHGSVLSLWRKLGAWSVIYLKSCIPNVASGSITWSLKRLSQIPDNCFIWRKQNLSSNIKLRLVYIPRAWKEGTHA